MIDKNIIKTRPHYSEGCLIQPIDVIEAWGFCYHLACVVKYLARVGAKVSAGDKNLILEDLREAKWYLERAISTKYAEHHTRTEHVIKSSISYIPQIICDDWQLSENLSTILHHLFLFQECKSLVHREKALELALKLLKEEIAPHFQRSQPTVIKTQSHNHNRKTNTHYFYKEVVRHLKEHMPELATTLLGKPNKGSEHTSFFRYGEKGQITIGIKGKHLGVYTNFEKNVKGGPLKLIEVEKKLFSTTEALKWASDWLRNYNFALQVEYKESESKKYTWRPIVPIPDHAGEPDIVGNKFLNKMLQDGSKIVGRHAYRDDQGNLKGYVIRIEQKIEGQEKPDKITPPLAYCENEEGHRYWRWTSFEKENRSLYGIEKLGTCSHKPILVVEGEKAADAAQKLLPEYHVLTWCGGTNAVRKTDWSLLIGKTVSIWPDNDEPGLRAARTIQNILKNLNAKSPTDVKIQIVKLPLDTPEQWDLANPLPKGWTFQKIINCVHLTGNTIHEH